MFLEALFVVKIHYRQHNKKNSLETFVWYINLVTNEAKALGSQRILTKVTEEFIQNASSYVNYKT